MGASVSYEKHYMFKHSNTVLIKHKLGNYIKPDGDDASPDGGRGEESEFEIDLQDNGSRCRLKAVKTKKYLRICGDGQVANIGGNGGKFTVFKIHRMSGEGTCKLESVQYPGKYIAVGRQSKVRVGTGGPWCELELFRKTKN